jgi:hypothetical protein
VRQVVWLGTSNIGHELVFEFCKTLSGAGVSHEEYLELVRLLRPKVSQCLGVRQTTFGACTCVPTLNYRLGFIKFTCHGSASVCAIHRSRIAGDRN